MAFTPTRKWPRVGAVHPRRGSSLERLGTGIVATIASTKAAFSITSLASLDSFSHPVPAPVFLVVVACYAVTGGYLMLMGRRDARSVPLGVLLLLVASSFSRRLLQAGAVGFPMLEPFLRAQQAIPVEAFLAFYFWQFVRDFPRRPVQATGLLKWMPRIALVTGIALFATPLVRLAAAALPDAILPMGGSIQPGGRIYWGLIFAVIMPGLPYALWRTRWVSPDERRRIRLLMFSLAFGFAPSLIVILLDSVWPTFSRWLDDPTSLPKLGVVLYPALLTIPLATAYSVLVHQALDVRLLVRRALQYALARFSIMIVSTLPFLGLGILLFSRRHDTIATVLGSTSGALLVTALAMGLLGLRGRRSVLDMLDRRFFREQYDAKQILAALVRRIPALRDPAGIEEEVVRSVGQALHVDRVHLLVMDRSFRQLISPTARIRPLSYEDDVRLHLGRLEGPVAVTWGRRGTIAGDLSEGGQHWLQDANARLLVPLLDDSAGLIGLLVLGEKRSELPFSAEDEALLSSMAGALSLAVLRLRDDARWPDRRAAHEQIASECVRCGLVHDTVLTTCRSCGAPTMHAALPRLLAGKFEVRSRLGEGGMGVVYLGKDTTLDRDVALKTLPRLSARDAERLRKEARVMAAVLHPNLALIFGTESWLGLPVLVVEYLPKGTLASYLAAGPLSTGDAISTVLALTSGLGCLHSAGILHRDIKPSNIGFGADDTPKLLDFGLARVRVDSPVSSEPAFEGSPPDDRSLADSRAQSGTLLYMSPEALDGGRPEASWDLWALALVLYEALAGRPPVTGGNPYQVVARISAGDIPDVRDFSPGTPPTVAVFLRDALSVDRRRRPSSVHEFKGRLSLLLHLERTVA